MKSYCTALALLGLAAPAFAQTTTIKPNPWLLPYPSGDVTGPATQACIGMFSDDHEADAALLAGGDVFLLYAPARVTSYSKVTGPFTSMAKVFLTDCPGAEGLLASSSEGLVLLHWDGTRQLAATPVSGSSEWADVVELQVVPGAAGTGDWICALSGARDTVYYAQWDGAGIEGTIAGSFGLLQPAVTLAGLNWDLDGILDFAIDDGTGAQLFDSEGTGVYLGEITCSTPRLLRFHQEGLTDELVWLTRDPAGTDQILTVIHSGDRVELEAPIISGAMTVGELTIADIDGDCLDDIVATRSDDHRAQVLYNQNPQSVEEMTFGLISPVISPLIWPLIEAWSAPNLPQVYDASLAVPAVAGGDIDGDGDDDLLFAGQPGSANTALVWFGQGVREESNGLAPNPKQVKAWIHSAQYLDWCWPNPGPEPEGDQAHLVIAPHSKPGVGTASIANGIRVTVWGRATETGPITPLRLVDEVYDADLLEIDVDIPLPALGSGQQPPRYLVTQIGYVVVENGAITQVLPGWTGQIDRVIGIPVLSEDGPTTTGGINQPQPPPSTPPPSP